MALLTRKTRMNMANRFDAWINRLVDGSWNRFPRL